MIAGRAVMSAEVTGRLAPMAIIRGGLLLTFGSVVLLWASESWAVSAAAMAVARRWETLVIPAVLCGTLGYATATFIGVAVGHWLR